MTKIGMCINYMMLTIKYANNNLLTIAMSDKLNIPLVYAKNQIKTPQSAQKANIFVFCQVTSKC